MIHNSKNLQVWLYRVLIFTFVVVVGGYIINRPLIDSTIQRWLGVNKLTGEQTTPPPPNYAVGEPNMLSVPSLGISAPIQYVTEAKESVFQVALANGVVHYPGTALPGQPGNVYIFGHSSDFAWSKGNYKTVFTKLPEVNIGESIAISDNTGKIFNYKIIQKKVVESKDTSVLAQNPTVSQLTLQTSYPIGTALKRYVVIAELVLKQ